jgi:Zn-dependent protease/CBS domain-containing protein
VAIKLGSVYGIPILIDYSWFLIFALIVYTVGFGLMPSQYPKLPELEYLSIGLLAAILLFGSVLLHELAHSIVAKRNGLKIGSITLFLFGGVSQMEEEPPDPKLELQMAAAGPLTSIAIAVITGVLWIISVDSNAPVLVQAPLNYSLLVNEIVAAFNLIPAFPLDGGRILHSILWYFNKDNLKSTRIASKVGQGFALLLVFGGVFILAAGDFFDGLWIILIGWFIWSGARSELSQMVVHRELSELKASNVMTSNLDSVAPEMSLSDLVSEFMQHRHNGYPVMSNGELVGCVTIDDVRKVRKEELSFVKVSQVMTPRERLITINESDSAEKALALMNANRIGRIFVLNDKGKISGIITRSDITKTIQMKEAFSGGTGAGSSGGAYSETQIPVEKGMLFEIEPKIGIGPDWQASFNSNEFMLVSEKIVELSDGRQTKQFTFQALQKGRFTILLSQGRPEPGKKAQSIAYSVIVN